MQRGNGFSGKSPELAALVPPCTKASCRTCPACAGTVRTAGATPASPGGKQFIKKAAVKWEGIIEHRAKAAARSGGFGKVENAGVQPQIPQPAGFGCDWASLALASLCNFIYDQCDPNPHSSCPQEVRADSRGED